MRKPGRHEGLARQGLESLLARGTLPARWLEQFQDLLQETSSAIARSAWPADTVRALHLVSLYAPIRYATWRGSGGEPTEPVRHQLVELSFQCEQLFWRGLAGCCEDAADIALFRLALGAESPVGDIRRGDGPSPNWTGEYRREITSVNWGNDRNWDLRVVCSIRFVSFYLDWLSERDLLAADMPQPPPDADWRSVIDELRARCEGLDTDAIWLIESWLRSSWLDRDQAGLPVLGVLRQRHGQTRLRAESEMVLLGG